MPDQTILVAKGLAVINGQARDDAVIRH